MPGDFGLRDPDELLDRALRAPLYGEPAAPIPLDPPAPPKVPDDPVLPIASPPPVVRDFAGQYGRDDLRRWAAALQMDGRDLDEIAVAARLNDAPVTAVELERILAERDPVDPLPTVVDEVLVLGHRMLAALRRDPRRWPDVRRELERLLEAAC